MIGYQEWRERKNLDNKFAEREARRRMEERERQRQEQQKSKEPPHA